MSQAKKPYLQEIPTKKPFRCAICKRQKTISTNHFTFCIIACKTCGYRTVYGCQDSFSEDVYTFPEAWLFESVDKERTILRKKCRVSDTVQTGITTVFMVDEEGLVRKTKRNE